MGDMEGTGVPPGIRAEMMVTGSPRLVSAHSMQGPSLAD